MKPVKLLAIAALAVSAVSVSACAVDQEYRQQLAERDAAIDAAAERQDWTCEYQREPGSTLSRKVCKPTEQALRDSADARQEHRMTTLQSQNPTSPGNGGGAIGGT